MDIPTNLPDLSLGLRIADLTGIGLFALTGAIMAARHRQTFVTVAFFALITGVGGGSIRDLLIGAPVFWIHDSLVAAVCFACALLTWFAPEKWWEGRFLEWLDALGIAGYAVFGTAKALSYGVPEMPAILMGIITACAGGIIRDIVAGVPSIIMRPELYVTATAAASGLYILLGLAIGYGMIAAVISAMLGFALRGAAIHWQVGLPTFGSKGGGNKP